MYKVYIKVNDEGFIEAVNSSAFMKDTEGFSKIDEGDGDRFHHAQGNYFEKPLCMETGEYRYKFAEGEITEM